MKARRRRSRRIRKRRVRKGGSLLAFLTTAGTAALNLARNVLRNGTSWGARQKQAEYEKHHRTGEHRVSSVSSVPVQ